MPHLAHVCNGAHRLGNVMLASGILDRVKVQEPRDKETLALLRIQCLDEQGLVDEASLILDELLKQTSRQDPSLQEGVASL